MANANGEFEEKLERIINEMDENKKNLVDASSDYRARRQQIFQKTNKKVNAILTKFNAAYQLATTELLAIQKTLVKNQSDSAKELQKKLIDTFRIIDRLVLILFSVVTSIGFILVIWFDLTDLPEFWKYGVTAFSSGLFFSLVAYGIKKRYEIEAIRNSIIFPVEEQFDAINIRWISPGALTDDEDERILKIEPVAILLDQAKGTIERTLPIMKEGYEEKKFFARWQSKCQDVLNALRSFGIDCLTEINWILVNLTDSARTTNEKEWRSLITSRLAGMTKIDYFVLDTLVLIYHRKDIREHWKNVLKEETRISTFAKVIYDSAQVDVTGLKLEEFNAIIRRMPLYESAQVTKNIFNYRMTQDYLKNCRTKLIENDLAIQQLSNLQVIDKIDFSLEFQQNLINIFSELFHQVAPKKDEMAFKKAVLAELLHSDTYFKQRVLFNNIDDETVKVLMLHDELLNKAIEEKRTFKLKELLEKSEEIEQIRERIDSRDRAYSTNFEFYKNMLHNGDWHEIGLLQKKVLQEMISKNAEQFKNLEKFEVLQQVIEKNFRRIDINTVERAISANMFSVYIILFKTTQGADFAKKIDTLSGWELDPGKSLLREKDLATIKDSEDRYAIRLTENMRPKYNFVHYSTSARIGVLPPEIPFDSFVTNVTNDLKMVLAKSEQRVEYETDGIVILRITPSKYSFGLLDSDLQELENVHASAKLEIQQFITQLASEYITKEGKAAITIFDSSIDMLDVINEFSILELIKQKDVTITEVDQKKLDSQSLNSKFQTAISEMGITSTRELATTLLDKSLPRVQIVKQIESVLLSEDIRPINATRYSNLLCNSVESFGLMWTK